MAEKKYYGDLEELKTVTGIRPEDLYFKDEEGGKTAEEKLDELLESWLVQIKDMIDQDRKRDYLKEYENGEREQIPPGIHFIALRIAANMIAQAMVRRDTPVLKVGEYAVKMAEENIFTNAIKKDLAKFPAKPRIKISKVKQEV